MLKSRFLVAAIVVACMPPALGEVRVTPQDSGVDVRLRGISAVNADVAWASGREGMVLRTLDGGRHWQVFKVPGAKELDFRDVEGFDAERAVVLSIGPGELSRVYRTDDGGKTWKLALQNEDPRAFFDCMAFDGERGWMLGDPVDGRFQILATDNGGRDWRLLDDGPAAVAGEAAFAASGTCIARIGNALVVGTGGNEARLHLRRDDEVQWQVLTSGMGRAKPEAGVFSLATLPDGVFAVGGDYTAEQAPGNAGQWRTEAAAATPSAVPAPRGYRSGAACLQHESPTCVAVGPSGVDAWRDGDWHRVADTGYDAIDLAGDAGWASGDAGRIARIEIISD
jgi:photosystem II stability/assembly factor-like uncharacterized protein